MAIVQADTIVDSAGSGAPDLANGLKISSGSTVLDHYSSETGSFTSASSTVAWEAVKIGNVVTLTMNPTAIDTGQTTASSAAGELSASLRPTKSVRIIHQHGSGGTVINAQVLADGTLTLQGLASTNLGVGANLESNTANHNFTVSYVIV